MAVRNFINRNYHHFNAAVLKDAAEAWIEHRRSGGKMFLTMAGAMSTAEIGISLGRLIDAGLIDGICCTGANLEEDVFNLVAHESYERVPNYRNLEPEFEQALYERGMNRVTDTCIPEDVAIRKIEGKILQLWSKADASGERFFPHEYMYQLLDSGELDSDFQIPLHNSWLIAACKKKLPIYVPGWEDSTLGNIFVSHVIRGDLSGYSCLKGGLEYMQHLSEWYQEKTKAGPVGFFQIGGGIAGDFPICVVPLIRQDLEIECPYWSYFCQISDSTTSYGSYSGAIPSEKITWGKLTPKTPSFVIESDASIVAPLLFDYLFETFGAQQN